MSLALSTLLYEWRRYMAAVVALAFSGLLVLAQVGMFVGIGKGFTAQIDRARADIMVLGPGAKALFGGPSGLPRRMIPLVYSHPEVTQVAPLDGSGGRFQNILSPEQQAKEEARAKRASKGEKGGGRRHGPQDRVRQCHRHRRDPRLCHRAHRLYAVDDRGPAPPLCGRGRRDGA